MCWYRLDIHTCGHAEPVKYLGETDDRYTCALYQQKLTYYHANVGRVGYPARCPPFGERVLRNQLNRKCQACIAQEVVRKRRDDKETRRKLARVMHEDP